MKLSAEKKQILESKYDTYANLLYRIAFSQLRNREDAEDVVQDVLIKSLSLKVPFTDESHERYWFIRVTINQCRDSMRHNKIRTYTPIEEVRELSSYDDETPYELLNILYSLPEKYRITLVLHHLEGFDINEIAKMLKVTKSAVKMRLVRGRELLKKELEKEEIYV